MVNAGEFTNETYLANPVDRCFFCKTNLYGCIERHSDAQILSAPISMTFENIGLGSRPPNVTPSVTPILRPVSTKRPCARSLANWAWALYL
jgi:hypothetical protein